MDRDPIWETFLTTAEIKDGMRVNSVIHWGLGLWLAMLAAVCLGQAVESVSSQRQTALALEQQGKDAEAAAIWRALLKHNPSNPEPYARLGLIEARQEQYEEAIPLYRKALSLSPSTPELRLNLGLALFKAGEMKEAVQVFEQLLKSQTPSSPEVQRLAILLGMGHYALGEFAKATPYLKRAAASDPENLSLRLSLAHSCLWSKQYQCVLDTYREILLLNAESAEADMLAGEALDELKDRSGAIKQFRAAVQANPTEPDVHFGLGYLLWTQRQYEEAANELHAELANNPNQIQALVYLGDAQMQMGHPEAALPMLEQVERVDPTISLGHLDLGILYADAGRNEDALHELNLAKKLTPDGVNVHWRLGRLYRAMGKSDEAKTELDRARKLTQATDEALINKMNGGGAKDKSGGDPSKDAAGARRETTPLR